MLLCRRLFWARLRDMRACHRPRAPILVVETNMTEKLSKDRLLDGRASDNVIPFPKKPGLEIDEDKYRLLSALLANEFETFKGRPLL